MYCSEPSESCGSYHFGLVMIPPTHECVCANVQQMGRQGGDLDERKDERIKFTTANIYLPDELSSSFSLSLYKQRLLACVLHMRIAVCEERVCLGALGY